MTVVGHRPPDVGAGESGPRRAGTDDVGDRSGNPLTSWPLSSWPLSVAAVLVVACVTSIVSIGRASFSLDESVSTTLARAPWSTFTQTVLHREANMSLYYVLLRLWVVFGHSEAVVRTLSVLAAVGAIAVIMAVTRRLFSRRVALIGGLLLCIDPLVVMFSQDARGYALSLLLVSASSAVFVVAVRRPVGPGESVVPARWWIWVAYAVLSALAAYANFWAALVPLAHGASLAFLPRRSAPWRRLVPTGIGLGVLLVPLALLIHATDSSGVNWAAGSSAGKLFTTARADLPHPVIDVGVFVVVGAVVWAVAFLRRQPTTQELVSHRVEAWPVAFALCWMVVPLAVVVLLSLAYKPLLVVRYLVICLPPFIMLVSYGLSRLRRSRATAALAGLVIVSVVGVGALYAHGSPQDWRAAVASVAARAEPGDGVVIFAPYTRIPFQWYIHEHPVAEARLHPLFPAGGWDDNALAYDTTIDVRTSTIEGDVAGYHRVWVVLSQQELYPAQDASLLAGLRSAGLAPVGWRSFHGVEVVEYA
jgi:mannosyltransferase